VLYLLLKKKKSKVLSVLN